MGMLVLVFASVSFTWCFISFSKTFKGNSNGQSVLKKTFAKPFVAQVLRVIPVASNGLSCLRMELYGCNGKHLTVHFVVSGKIFSSFCSKLLRRIQRLTSTLTIYIPPIYNF